MLFNSWQFIFVFLPVALGVFFAIPAAWRTQRKLWLCAASFFFYSYWKVEYVPLLVVSILFNYGVAEWINRWRGRPIVRWILIGGVAANLVLLGYYKYTNFIRDIFGQVMNQEMGRLDILLPLAISFFTFTQIGYLVDVSRDPKLHYGFLDYSLFVVFFPHLIAGPIVRHWEIIPQYADRDIRPNRDDLGSGTALFLMGLFKKVLLADPVAVYANAMYGAAGHGVTLTCFDAWFGTLAYAMQIYFDFSGYSDMAIGLARMFGIRFPGNFDSPYRGDSIGEFWRRWHMSLTRFLREYVYIPLGGNRRGPGRQVVNIMITFLLSGLWHGAGWTFVIWGLLHGAYQVVALEWKRWLKKLGYEPKHWSYRGACVFLTFVMVLFTWVFFRSPNLQTSGRVLGSMFGVNGLTLSVETTNPQKPFGQFLTAAGARFVPDTAGVQGYTEGIRLVVLLLAIAWFLPNTQQWLSAYRPLLDEDRHPSRWHLPLNGYTAIALGIGLFFVVRTYYTAVASPFLYFNF